MKATDTRISAMAEAPKSWTKIPLKSGIVPSNIPVKHIAIIPAMIDGDFLDEAIFAFI